MVFANFTPSLIFTILSTIGGGSVVYNVHSLRTEIEQTNKVVQSKLLEIDVAKNNEMVSSVSDLAKKGSGTLAGLERIHNPLLKNLNEEFGKNLSYLMNENPLMLVAIISGLGYVGYKKYQELLDHKETSKQN